MPNAGSSKKYVWIAGLGVVAAALIVYFSLNWPPIPGKQVQGAIGSRDVYRQAQIADKDVGVAGQAKVTTDDLKRLVASPQFRELASNANFQLLVGSHALEQMKGASALFNQSFAAIMQNPGYAALFQSPEFHKLVNSAAFNSILLLGNEAVTPGGGPRVLKVANEAGLTGNSVSMVAQVIANSSLNQLFSNPAFVNLFNNPNFNALMNNGMAQQLFQMPGIIYFASMTQVANLASQGQLGTLVNSAALQNQLFMNGMTAN